MGLYENWRKVDCPECPARAGHACYFEPGDYRAYHKKRFQLAEQQIGRAPLSLPRTVTVTPAKAHQMRRWCSHCKKGHPEMCSGVRRSKFQRGKLPCENPHRLTPLVTLSDDACIE